MLTLTAFSDEIRCHPRGTVAVTCCLVCGDLKIEMVLCIKLVENILKCYFEESSKWKLEVKTFHKNLIWLLIRVNWNQ